jgi:1-deoxy-D-xylulose-5-phosphate synthase
MNDAFPLLSQIVQPTDLHKLSPKELRQVADEVRQAILQKVSQTGGHFSSNLGTVELTVAMYAAYHMPPDKVIWDTGHQAYPHKLLTGRLPRFETLRKDKGISGFLKRSEHELDYFGAGHAGTAISAALGFAAARDQLGGTEKVVAVTGDAAICNGMSWEALNHAGDIQADMTVVLNDNRMSIAPNVGAMTKYFTRLRSRPFVQKSARRAKGIIERIPGPAPRIAAGLRHGITHSFAPEETGTIFEEMGFEYIGPVDGHDLESLVEIFRNIREMKLPFFVHAITVKGKGYDVAEQDATKWHGVIPFDPQACEMPSKGGSQAYQNVFGDALVELADEDPKITAITAGMPDGTGLGRFAETYPKRFHDVGIAEEHAVTFAAGLAAGGAKPFVAIYSTFLQRAFDQIEHDICLQDLPVRFCLDRAGLVGADGPTHHGTFDISYLTMLPKMALCAPRDGTELREMMRFMAGWNKGPIAVRYPRGGAPDNLPESRTPIELGRAESLGIFGEGRPQAALLAIGSMVGPAVEAAEKLASEGRCVEVINARWAKPLDERMILRAAGQSGRIITIEENVLRGGFGEAVRTLLADEDVTVKTLSLPDAFIEHGSVDRLLSECGLDAAGIADAVRSLVPSSKS